MFPARLTRKAWGSSVSRIDEPSAGRAIFAALFLGLTAFATATGLDAQQYGARLGAQEGGAISFEPRGRGVMFGALDPVVRRWYVPQELYNDYRWRQWEYSNYARQYYQRYVDTRINGDYFYDFYGDYIGFGWLIYDWRQQRPSSDGSGIFKGDEFRSFFSNLTVSGDSQGQYGYAITVGTELRTTLTPMTFSKPVFNGVQIDFASDRYAATILASRISDPVPFETVSPLRRRNITSLVGGRATVQVGDYITLGGTLVDARNGNTALERGDPIAGSLTLGQSGTPVTAIAIVLSDDSPEDGEGGAALFGHDVQITVKDFDTGEETVHTLAEVVRQGTEWPAVVGGFDREGYLAADGAERIVLNYDFTDPAFQLLREDGTRIDASNIIEVEFEYLLANDYRIQMWSNRQTGSGGEKDVPQPPLTGALIDQEEPVLFTIERARGNVVHATNVQVVSFHYGLPTANLVGGFTVEATDLFGFDFYGEWDRNVRYSQYPNTFRFSANKGHEISSRSAEASLLTISRQAYPYFAFAELYSIDEDYSTSAFVSNNQGDFKYDQPVTVLYEFVDDNDDNDRRADWSRAGGGGTDTQVYPGWDENWDFISDFNQNDSGAIPNRIPDYDEPFLRHDVDRPEFLFGIDLNNNAWIDRFEDDDLPDYPYKADRRGYNVFGGIHLTPESRLFVGRTDEEMLSDERQSTGTYALFTVDKDYPDLGRVRVFDMLRRVADRIPDDRRASALFRGAPLQPLVPDILPAPDTWINTAWLGLDYAAIPRLKIINKLKYELYNQEKGARDIDGRPLDEVTTFFGLVNKVEYRLDAAGLSLYPKLKSEFLYQEAFTAEGDDRQHWQGLFTLMARLPFLKRSEIAAGIELARFAERTVDEEAMIEQRLAGETGDLRSAVFGVQMSNRSEYLGYRLTTQLGIRITRLSTEHIELARTDPDIVFAREREGETETMSFFTIYAGLE